MASRSGWPRSAPGRIADDPAARVHERPDRAAGRPSTDASGATCSSTTWRWTGPRWSRPRCCGAVGPKSLALAAELSDGTILTGGSTPEQAAAARAIIDPAAAAAGRGRPSLVAFLEPESGVPTPDGGGRRTSAGRRRRGHRCGATRSGRERPCGVRPVHRRGRRSPALRLRLRSGVRSHWSGVSTSRGSPSPVQSTSRTLSGWARSQALAATSPSASAATSAQTAGSRPPDDRDDRRTSRSPPVRTPTRPRPAGGPPRRDPRRVDEQDQPRVGAVGGGDCGQAGSQRRAHPGGPQRVRHDLGAGDVERHAPETTTTGEQPPSRRIRTARSTSRSPSSSRHRLRSAEAPPLPRREHQSGDAHARLAPSGTAPVSGGSPRRGRRRGGSVRAARPAAGPDPPTGPGRSRRRPRRRSPPAYGRRCPARSARPAGPAPAR